MSWALLLILMAGGCSSLGIIQDHRNISTPETAALSAQSAKDVAAYKNNPYYTPAPPNAMPVGQSVLAQKVALLVPLSGKSAPLGQAMVNAAQLTVFEMGSKDFELMPRDTKGTPAGAVQAAGEALASGAQLIIGPLFAGDVAAVKSVIKPSGVSLLALSTDVSLAENGAFVMGFAPAPQVKRVIAFAVSQGVRHFAAVAPTGPYGKLVMDAFDEAVRESGGVIVATETPATVAALASHKDEIEAVFVPFGGAALRTIAGQLAGAGFEKGHVRLIGTGLWDEPHVAEGQPLLEGGWFAAPDPTAREKFMTTYQSTYGQPAPRLATLAFDATALAVVLARHGLRYDNATLTSPSGFAGIDGVFRLMETGQIERGLAVIEVTGTETRVADPAPTAFTR
ncbi:MAG: penicillin-binding protein activator [Bdellovibrionales bacterium]